MRMVRDTYTGELYDADKMYRGANACWIEKEAERKHLMAMEQAAMKRRKGRRPNRRSSERYSEWLRLDSPETFGEFLKRKYGKRRPT